jgi:Tol biopolymer transport system component
MGPWIGKSETSKKLMWYAAPLIAVSPDGEKLAYIAKSNNFNNLYIKNIAGGRTTVQRSFNKNVLDMSYSPDNNKISFTENRSGDYNINLINANEGVAVQQVASTKNKELGPSFAPDGNSVFYTKQEGGRFHIWNMNLETSLVTQYTEGFTPVVTPNGGHLLITRNSKDGFRGEIWMIDLKRGTETLILNDPEKGFSSPDISPDGKTIVCVGVTPKSETRPENLDIYTVKLDGTKLNQITFHGGHDVSPQWAPDGKSIFMISQRGNEKGEFNVWKMDLTTI